MDKVSGKVGSPPGRGRGSGAQSAPLVDETAPAKGVAPAKGAAPAKSATPAKGVTPTKGAVPARGVAAVEAERDGGPRTLRRGLRILGVLRRAGAAGLHVTEIAAQTGMQRSTVYRFLDVLVDEGYAVRDGDKPRYRVLHADTDAADPHEQAIRRWRPAMRRISDAIGDSVFLICRAGDDSLCLHREMGNYPVQVLTVTVGHRQPLGVGAAGLALLAALPPAEAADIIARNETAFRGYGGLTAAHIRRLVESTRDRGWSVIGNTAVPGVLGVGMAWCDGEGYPRLAISLSTLIDRMPAARQRTIAEVLRAELAAR